MTTTIKQLGNENGIQWIEINGADYGTSWKFENETYGITSNGCVVDCDAYPLTEGDREEIAVKNSFNA